MSPAVPGQIRYPKIEKTKCVMKILFTSQEIFNQLYFLLYCTYAQLQAVIIKKKKGKM